jgi:Zn-dependent M28 family amino/carboxypeptidase
MNFKLPGLAMIRMPGSTFRGASPPFVPAEETLAARLKEDVEALAGRIGSRNYATYAELQEAARYLETRLRETGYPEVLRENYDYAGKIYANLSVEIAGKSLASEIVIVGGHYDSVVGCPGANDNASGTAAVLALAQLFAKSAPARTLRFTAFTNEEPPHFQTDHMGSRVNARNCRARGENVVAMLSLETIGFYSDAEGSQSYPLPFSLFYPSKANFIGFIGNVGSGDLVRRAIRTFREKTPFPSEGAALPGFVPGVGWSDQWSFWEEGYPAIMVTDTALFRYPHYHASTDTPDKIDYLRCARVVHGLREVVAELSGCAAP